MNSAGYEDYLALHGSLTYSFTGTSMLPMLRQGQDLITVEKKGAARLRKYDVALYRRPPTHYVLHRIVEVREEDYVLLGDNCLNREYGITDEQILGVLTAFKRGKRNISVENPLYRLYAHAVVALYPLRRVRIRLMAAIRKRVAR